MGRRRQLRSRPDRGTGPPRLLSGLAAGGDGARGRPGSPPPSLARSESGEGAAPAAPEGNSEETALPSVGQATGVTSKLGTANRRPRRQIRAPSPSGSPNQWKAGGGEEEEEEGHGEFSFPPPFPLDGRQGSPNQRRDGREGGGEKGAMESSVSPPFSLDGRQGLANRKRHPRGAGRGKSHHVTPAGDFPHLGREGRRGRDGETLPSFGVCARTAHRRPTPKPIIRSRGCGGG